ncbi:MAG: hypothetical protein ACX94C_07590 [Phycisphaerales bacterium]
MESITGSAIQEVNKLNKAAARHDWMDDKCGGAMIIDENGKSITGVAPHERNMAETVQGFGDMVINLWDRRGQPDESVITVCQQGLSFKTHATSHIHNSHRCELNLTMTQQFRMLIGMHEANGKAFRQKDLNKWLRKNFPDSHMNTECMPTMREIKFKLSSESSQSTQHATDEMSNSAKRQALGINGSALPEFGTLTVQVWSQAPDVKVDIRCAIDIDMDEQLIEICPIAGEIDTAIIDAVQDVDTQITDIIGERKVAIVSDATLGHKTVM